MPEVILNGPEGRLEGRYVHSKKEAAPIALLLHPHPQHGGTMNNKVVYSMFQNFVNRGFSTLRFNFRGVGRSQGLFDRGEGELSDAASALDWLQTYNIAPPANMFDFTFLAPCPASGLMVHGDSDTVVPPDSVKKLVDKLSAQKGIVIDHVVVKNADHYFGKHLEDVNKAVTDYLNKSLPEAEQLAATKK